MSEHDIPEGMRPDLDQAVAWLRSWTSEPILSAAFIHPTTHIKGNFETRRFSAPCDWDLVRAWIADRQHEGNWCNIYYAVNPATGEPDAKTKRSDVSAMVALHVDVDCRPGEDQELGTKRILKVLGNMKPPPSTIVLSGGGAQGLWRLSAPVPVSGNLAIAENLKLYNVALRRECEGDTVENLDRILRVPFTVNIPDAGKIKKGRKPALAGIASQTNTTYPLSDFTPAQPEAPPTEEGFVAKKASDYGAVDPKDGRLVKLSKEWLDLGLLGDTKNEYRDAGGKTDRSRMALAFVTAALRAQIDADTIAAILMDKAWKIGECIRDKGGETKRQLKRIIERGRKFVEDDQSKPPVLGKDTWTKSAGVFLNRLYPDGLIHWRDDWMAWREGFWRVIEEGTIRSQCLKFLNDSKLVVKKKPAASEEDEEADRKAGEIGRSGEPEAKPNAAPPPPAGAEDEIAFKPFNPSNNDVNELYGALKGLNHIDRDLYEQPCWLNGIEDRPDPRECINCQNGILHVPTRTLLPHTPDFFTTNITAFEYNAAAKCPVWERTIHEYWPDEGALETLLLQEMFGYSLLPWTSLQKVFAVVGPGRSGKGTIAHVLELLIGSHNVASPSMGHLCTDFGKQTLLQKTLAVVGEATFGKKDDRAAITNFIKTVSGEDKVSIPRKYQLDWVGQLLVRFWLFSNKIPDFEDAGKALMMRLVCLKMTRTFADNPDTTLGGKLADEVAGILNWALAGYDRLVKAVSTGGGFTIPAASAETAEQFGRLANPLMGFLDDYCVVDPGASVPRDDLHAAYEEWCDKVNMKPGSMARAMRDIEALGRFTCRKVGGHDASEREWRMFGMTLKNAAPARRAKRGRQDHDQDKIPF